METVRNITRILVCGSLVFNLIIIIRIIINLIKEKKRIAQITNEVGPNSPGILTQGNPEDEIYIERIHCKARVRFLIGSLEVLAAISALMLLMLYLENK